MCVFGQRDFLSFFLSLNLSDIHVVNIRHALVNKALDELKEVNPLYRVVCIDETWESESKENVFKFSHLLIRPL